MTSRGRQIETAMMDADGFLSTAQRWHDFYLLTGGAAATLTGLMFVAVGFGAGLVTDENATAVRAFIDPPLSHFLHVIVTACLLVMPTMTGHVLGSLLLVGVGVRVASLVWIFRRYMQAHRKFGDMELSDWLLGIVFPALAFVTILVAAAGFMVGHPTSFTLIAAGTLAVLVIGVRNAWELMLWLVMEVGRRQG
jgi:hypothetical protein